MTDSNVLPQEAGVGEHEENGAKGWVFDIQRYSIQDGPGIRTTVFLMGCPLKCLWCSNPESQRRRPQLFYHESLCQRCYRCVKACPTGATRIVSEGAIEIDRTLCKACGECVKACPNDARTISGKLMSVEEVYGVIKKDAPFYRNSNGGVTFSGGEPTSQPDFLRNLLKTSVEHGLHTCLETTGCVDTQVFETILEYTDLVLYDFKHMDPARHKEFTGVDNHLILKNAQRTISLGIPLIVRVPLIPGCNDSEENVRALAEYMVKHNLDRVDLLPYHKLGTNKYQSLGRQYQLTDLRQFDEEEVEGMKRKLESFGLEVGIG